VLRDDGSAWERLYVALSPAGTLHLFASAADARGGGARPVRSVAVAAPPGAGAGEAAAIAASGWETGRGVIEVTVRAPGPMRGRVLVLRTVPAAAGAPAAAEAQRLTSRWASALRAAAAAGDGAIQAGRGTGGGKERATW
jgi:hypothetical protein